MSMTEFLSNLGDIFPSYTFHRIFYTDNEGDAIICTEEEQWEEALDYLAAAPAERRKLVFSTQGPWKNMAKKQA
jgi:hypothetical protein